MPSRGVVRRTEGRVAAHRPGACLVSGPAGGGVVMSPRHLLHPAARCALNVTAEPPKAFKALLVRTGGDGDEEDGGNVSMSAGPDGSSVASYVPRLAGEWRLHVRLRGKEVGGSPFRCVIEAQTEAPTALLVAKAEEAARYNGNALQWDADVAPQWEAYRSPRAEYVRRELGHDVGAPLPSPQDTALAWKLAKIDPHSYERAQLEGCEGGAAGSHGRYMARKRAALLHYQIAGLTASLALAGPDDPVAVAAERAAAEAKGEEVARPGGARGNSVSARALAPQRLGARRPSRRRRHAPRPAPLPRSPSSGGGMSADAALSRSSSECSCGGRRGGAARQGTCLPGAAAGGARRRAPKRSRTISTLWRTAASARSCRKESATHRRSALRYRRRWRRRAASSRRMKKLGLEKAGGRDERPVHRLTRQSGTISYHELKKLASETGAKRGALQL